MTLDIEIVKKYDFFITTLRLFFSPYALILFCCSLRRYRSFVSLLIFQCVLLKMTTIAVHNEIKSIAAKYYLDFYFRQCRGLQHRDGFTCQSFCLCTNLNFTFATNAVQNHSYKRHMK